MRWECTAPLLLTGILVEALCRHLVAIHSNLELVGVSVRAKPVALGDSRGALEIACRGRDRLRLPTAAAADGDLHATCRKGCILYEHD